eukprot:1344357-Amorphochlora_amoeboformis.AAC.1
MSDRISHYSNTTACYFLDNTLQIIPLDSTHIHVHENVYEAVDFPGEDEGSEVRARGESAIPLTDLKLSSSDNIHMHEDHERDELVNRDDVGGVAVVGDDDELGGL